MDRYLVKGQELQFDDITGIFTIQEMIGRGASCVVYYAHLVDENGICTEHLLKEYNPKHLDMSRDEDGRLKIKDSDNQALFELGLRRFQQGYEKQASIRMVNALKNTTSNIQGIHKGYGTEYIDMTCFNGMSYEKVKEKSLYDLLCRAKALTTVVGNYHSTGFLHLDIKPENIFTISDTCDLVMLFDFDSVIEKSVLPDGVSLSYTKAWAAPEQVLQGRKRCICEATDIFAIGEIIFEKLMGRHSESEERRSFSEYEFDYNSEMLKNVNPKVYPLLQDLFRHTLCSDVKKRYQSASELICKLDKIIEFAAPKEPYLKGNLPVVQEFFVGRGDEIAEIHRKLAENRILFLSGIGGIGKSELAKHYAEKHKKDYDTVIFSVYRDNIAKMVCDNTKIPVHNFVLNFANEELNPFEQKLEVLSKLCDRRTLIIIDNFDIEAMDEDENSDRLFTLDCTFLITSRSDFSKYYPQITLTSFKEKSDICRVFAHAYERTINHDECITATKIINYVDGHTLVVELLARQMIAERVPFEKMYLNLQMRGLSGSGVERVRIGKDGGLSKKRSAFEHIKTLFNMSNLSKDEKVVMANLSLVPNSGMSTAVFKDICGFPTYGQIDSLIEKGWVYKDSQKDYISLHPVVTEIARELYQENPQWCVGMKKYMRREEKAAQLASMGTSKNVLTDLLIAGGVTSMITGGSLATGVGTGAAAIGGIPGALVLGPLVFGVTSAMKKKKECDTTKNNKNVSEKTTIMEEAIEEFGLEEMIYSLTQEMIKNGESKDNIIAFINNLKISDNEKNKIKTSIMK